MRHNRLLCGRSNADYSSSFAQRPSSGPIITIEIARRNFPERSAGHGGCLTVASEPIFTTFDLPAAKRSFSWNSQNWFDYFALTKPEVNFLIVITTLAGFYL